jgi:hypothetical protein
MRVVEVERAAAGVVAALVMAGVVGLHAHHSIAAVYDRSRPVTLEGIVVQFALVNPHPFLVIEVKGSRVEGQWRGELDNRFELVAIGMTADSLKAGERVVVRGSESRTQPRSIYILRLDRPADGFWYEQTGMSPTIGTR